ncbi:MAG: hydroxymyristoyl-ACP dehydratase [Idiomarina sp. 34-48-12]|nr:MAG: hydroxymyristoyl-ACP dehydratase [Idiomarina sp. 34-48-12]
MVSLNQLIKHEAPMRLIDKFVSGTDLHAHCQAVISADNLFYREQLNGLPAHTGVELMAQTIAAAAGYRNRLRDEPIKIGFLLGSRKYTCSIEAFKTGECYDIFAEEIHAEPSGLSVFGCRIEHNGSTVAEARLNVYQPPDEAAFIEENYE